MRRGAVLTSVVLLSSFALQADADSVPPSKVLTNYETLAVPNVVSRDAGYSAPIPGTFQSVWVFGDTFWTGQTTGWTFGSTAAMGPFTPGWVPTTLTELPSPPAPLPPPGTYAPQPFLPPPAGLVDPQGSPCGAVFPSTPGTWPTGIANIPGSHRMLITFNDVCLTFPETISVQRSGVMEYDPLTNQIVSRSDLFSNQLKLPFQHALSSPIFMGTAPDAYLYVFGWNCDNDGNASGFCFSGRITLARVAADPLYWRNAASYQFWNGTTWTPDASQAVSVLPFARPTGAHVIDARHLGKGFVIVEQNDLYGTYTIWRSESLTGGWTATTTGQAPCAKNGVEIDVCRGYVGHAELSTSTHLLMSYYNPAEWHTSVLAVPWSTAGTSATGQAGAASRDQPGGQAVRPRSDQGFKREFHAERCRALYPARFHRYCP